jgi:hypothetical protein
VISNEKSAVRRESHDPLGGASIQGSLTLRRFRGPILIFRRKTSSMRGLKSTIEVETFRVAVTEDLSGLRQAKLSRTASKPLPPVDRR